MYSSIIVNFHITQYINLKLKLMKNKGYHVKWPVHWDIVDSLLLKPLKQCLIDITSFRLSKSHYSWFVLLSHFWFRFWNCLDVECTRSNSQHTVVSFLSISYFSNNFNFYSEAKILLVNSTSLLLIALFKKYRETSSTRPITITIVTSVWDLYSYVCARGRQFSFSRTRRWLNSQNSLLLGKLYWNQWLAQLLYLK